jgi:hypothetical protein
LSQEETILPAGRVAGAFYRMLHEPKKWELTYWWICRAFFIYGLICTVFWMADPTPPAFTTIVPIPEQNGAGRTFLVMLIHLLVTFLWEFFQFAKPTSAWRLIPRYFQVISCTFALVTAFFGAFVNLYYNFYWWDTAIHFFGGALCVMLGYELCTMIQHKQHAAIPMPVIILCSVGMCFTVTSIWELFEFTFDQVAWGDMQHWSLALAKEAGVVHPIFKPAPEPGAAWDARYAIMDTMSDMVMNFLGCVAALIALLIYPYHHKKPESNPNVLYSEHS